MTDKPKRQQQPKTYIELFHTARRWLLFHGFVTDGESDKVKQRIDKRILKERGER